MRTRTFKKHNLRNYNIADWCMLRSEHSVLKNAATWLFGYSSLITLRSLHRNFTALRDERYERQLFLPHKIWGQERARFLDSCLNSRQVLNLRCLFLSQLASWSPILVQLHRSPILEGQIYAVKTWLLPCRPRREVGRFPSSDTVPGWSTQSLLAGCWRKISPW
jgi:hypothetical protein